MRKILIPSYSVELKVTSLINMDKSIVGTEKVDWPQSCSHQKKPLMAYWIQLCNASYFYSKKKTTTKKLLDQNAPFTIVTCAYFARLYSK